jgi:hypothetical protein
MNGRYAAAAPRRPTRGPNCPVAIEDRSLEILGDVVDVS